MNFRPAWWHARDHGLVTAKRFARSAMKQGTTSQMVVNPGETLTLRFAVYVHCGVETETIQKAYHELAESSR